MKQVILISGAARGLGFVSAEHLHRAGYYVCGTGRNPSPADAPFRLLPLDVGDAASVQACVVQVQVQAVVLLKQLLPQALFERFIMRQFVQPG